MTINPTHNPNKYNISTEISLHHINSLVVIVFSRQPIETESLLNRFPRLY